MYPDFNVGFDRNRGGPDRRRLHAAAADGFGPTLAAVATGARSACAGRFALRRKGGNLKLMSKFPMTAQGARGVNGTCHAALGRSSTEASVHAG